MAPPLPNPLLLLFLQAAYQNREKSLKYLDDIKATFIYMYFTFGEWDRLHR